MSQHVAQGKQQNSENFKEIKALDLYRDNCNTGGWMDGGWTTDDGQISIS